MAKLKAHGTEVYRLVKNIPTSDQDRDSFDHRYEVAIFKDRWVLKKHSCKFKDPYSKNGIRPHTWGWKRDLKIKESLSLEQAKDIFINRFGYHLVAK